MAAHLLPTLPAGVEWLALHAGESGDRVYRRSDGAAVAKLCDAHNIARLEEERRRIEWLTSFALGTPQLLDWSVAEDGGCLAMSALPGVPASALDPAELRRAWPSLAERIKTLHALPIAQCPFDRKLARMFAQAEQIVSLGAVRTEFLPPELRNVPSNELLAHLRAELAQRLVQERHDLVVCHGDACLPNFIVDPDTLRCVGMVDLGRLGAADRYVDLSLLIGNARAKWESEADADRAKKDLFDVYGSTPDEERLRFYLRLDPLTW